MNLLSQITLKWYDDSSMLLDDRRGLVELFMDSLGISRGVASDVFEVLLIAKSKNVSIGSAQIKKDIIELRSIRGQSADDSLTMRNIQIWLKYFRNIGLVEKLGGRYLFRGNRKPSDAFRDGVKPEVIDKSSDYLCRVLEKLEKEYEIRK